MQGELRIFLISGFNILARDLSSFAGANVLECDAV
jgi:hypothetical protein